MVCSLPDSDFKSSKKNPWNFRIFQDFLDFFRIFSGFFWVYKDFMNKKGFKQ